MKKEFTVKVKLATHLGDQQAAEAKGQREDVGRVGEQKVTEPERAFRCQRRAKYSQIWQPIRIATRIH